MRILHRGATCRIVNEKGYSLVAVLLRRASENGWDVMVIGGNHPAYRVGGYDLFLFDSDLRDAEEVTIG